MVTSDTTVQQLADAGIRLDDEGPILRVTLDQPDRRNAQTRPPGGPGCAGEDLPETARVVILSGTAPAFSAGLGGCSPRESREPSLAARLPR